MKSTAKVNNRDVFRSVENAEYPVFFLTQHSRPPDDDVEYIYYENMIDEESIKTYLVS